MVPRGASHAPGEREREGEGEMTGVVGPARRRRPLVVATAAAVVLGLGGLAAVVIAGRPGPSPVLATVAATGGRGLPVIGMDEGASRVYVATRPGGGPGGAAAVRVLDAATGALVGTVALPLSGQNGSGGAITAVAVDARRERAYAVSTGSSSCASSGGDPQTCARRTGARPPTSWQPRRATAICCWCWTTSSTSSPPRPWWRPC